ncbi:MAG: MlaD family protein [Treponema sp.]|nr:MlaD family protein [Treponema sp.]
MKFRIRFADQIVGFFIILALASLVFIIIMLGRSQRWFARDAVFHTEFVSGAGLSKNMPVSYKGFTIGNVNTFYLNESDQVEVEFKIYEQYRDRVKQGSMVELMVSPVGLGNQFLFHPGNGTDLVNDNDFIPSADSAMARNYIRDGLADDPRHDDSISLVLNRVSSTLDGINKLLPQIDDALRGTDSTELGQIIRGVNRTIAGAETLPATINSTAGTLLSDIDDIKAMLDKTLASIYPILSDVNSLTAAMADPDSSVSALLSTDGDVYRSLTQSLNSLAGIIGELDKTAAFIPGQLPQIAGMISDLRVTLKTAEDVLTALTNNPLLKGGIPARIEIQSSGTSPRDVQF